MAITSPIQRTPFDRLRGTWNLDDSLAALWADVMQRTLTPWMRNPLGLDPLRDLLRRHFDKEAVRGCHGIKAFIAATNVQTGKSRIFTREELTLDAVLASACLPNVHEAVLIDGIPYRDGGFRGNRRSGLHLQLRQPRRGDRRARSVVPAGRAEIQRRVADRLNEITFGGADVGCGPSPSSADDRKGAITGDFGTRLKKVMIHRSTTRPRSRRWDRSASS